MTCPLPADPVLAELAMAANAAGTWTIIFDTQWRWVYWSDESRISQSSGSGMPPVPLGKYFFSSESMDADGMVTTYPASSMRQVFDAVGPWVLADTPGGREELRRLVDPRLAEAVGQIPVSDRSTAVSFEFLAAFSKSVSVPTVAVAQRVFDSDGRRRGVVVNAKPAAGMSAISSMVATGDLEHLARMQSVARARRQQAGILFADLEGSSQLSRRLSTAAYFALARGLVAAADASVVEAGGIVGRHVGDGVVAFFLAQSCGSESAAAAACIAAARSLRPAVAEIASCNDLDPDDVRLRFGLHWGSTLFMGMIATRGRSEVTALGDEVNEAARIEVCATGGRTLASKELIERLEPVAAQKLGIDQDRIAYTPLGDLKTATEKVRRDAPAIAVCDL